MWSYGKTSESTRGLILDASAYGFLIRCPDPYLDLELQSFECSLLPLCCDPADLWLDIGLLDPDGGWDGPHRTICGVCRKPVHGDDDFPPFLFTRTSATLSRRWDESSPLHEYSEAIARQTLLRWIGVASQDPLQDEIMASQMLDELDSILIMIFRDLVLRRDYPGLA